MDKCAKHDEIMERTFTEMGSIKLKLENIDTKMDAMIEFKNMVHAVVFGNGKPGIKGRLEILGSHITKLWVFLGLLMTAVLTAAAVVVFKG